MKKVLLTAGLIAASISLAQAQPTKKTEAEAQPIQSATPLATEQGGAVHPAVTAFQNEGKPTITRQAPAIHVTPQTADQAPIGAAQGNGAADGATPTEHGTH